jgi:hypothetical protein
MRPIHPRSVPQRTTSRSSWRLRAPTARCTSSTHSRTTA